MNAKWHLNIVITYVIFRCTRLLLEAVDVGYLFHKTARPSVNWPGDWETRIENLRRLFGELRMEIDGFGMRAAIDGDRHDAMIKRQERLLLD